MSSAAVSLPRRFASLVKLEHTVFALPFAYIAMVLAAGAATLILGIGAYASLAETRAAISWCTLRNRRIVSSFERRQHGTNWPVVFILIR